MQESAAMSDTAWFELAMEMALPPPSRTRGDWWVMLNLPRLRRTKPDWPSIVGALKISLDRYTGTE